MAIPAPLTDPSVNVKELVELRAAYDREIRGYERELRKQESKWRDKLAAAEARRLDDRLARESGRVDAIVADIRNAVLVASKEATTTAETLRKAQETQDTSTRTAIRAVEQNQAGGVGRGIAAREVVAYLIAGLTLAALLWTATHR